MINYQEKFVEEGFLEESEDQKKYANYRLYSQLKNIGYSEEQILIQLYCTIEELEALKAMFE